MTYGFLLLFAIVRTISYHNWFVYLELYCLQLFTIIAYHFNKHTMILRYVVWKYIWPMESLNYELIAHMPDISWRLKTKDLCGRRGPRVRAKKEKKFGLRHPQTSLVLSRQEMSGIWANVAWKFVLGEQKVKICIRCKLYLIWKKKSVLNMIQTFFKSQIKSYSQLYENFVFININSTENLCRFLNLVM